MPLELVVFVGLQGAGKSTYYRDHFRETHVLVSKDLWPNSRNKERRQTEEIEAALSAGRSVVVDNTNPTAEVRARLIAQGKARGARLIAYGFDTPFEVATARNAAREGRARVPDVALGAVARVLALPTLGEGFDEVHIIGPGSRL